MNPASYNALFPTGTPSNSSVSWRFIKRVIKSPIVYNFLSSTTAYNLAVQIRDQRVPVTKIEYKAGASWVAMTANPYNYYTCTPTTGAPFSLRVTGSTGEKQSQGQQGRRYRAATERTRDVHWL